MMWRVPQGIKVLINGRWRDDIATVTRPVPVWHGSKYGPEVFSNGVALAMGFKPIRHVNFDTEHYKKTGESEEEIDGTVVIIPSTEAKYTVPNLKKKFNKQLKSIGRPALLEAKAWIDYYTEFDNSNPKKAEWQQYITDIKAAYQTIKAEGIAISNYDDLVAYIRCEPDPATDGWRKHMPIEPDESE